MKREPADWKLRAGRRSTAIPGWAQRDDGSSVRVLLSNISYEGCHVLAEGDLTVGEVLKVDIPRMGLMEAQVRWSSDDQAGLRFMLGQSGVEARRARIGV